MELNFEVSELGSQQLILDHLIGCMSIDKVSGRPFEAANREIMSSQAFQFIVTYSFSQLSLEILDLHQILQYYEEDYLAKHLLYEQFHCPLQSHFDKPF